MYAPYERQFVKSVVSLSVVDDTSSVTLPLGKRN